MADYEVLLLGSSTWGSGELQDDWYDFLTGLEALDLKGKKIAIFGLGDESMSDTFCNAVGIIYKSLQPTGATFIGRYPDSVYHSRNRKLMKTVRDSDFCSTRSTTPSLPTNA